MSAEVVNLRLARKAKARLDHAADGAANRAKHGRSKNATEAARLEADIAARRHEGHRLGPSPDGPNPHDDFDGDAA